MLSWVTAHGNEVIDVLLIKLHAMGAANAIYFWINSWMLKNELFLLFQFTLDTARELLLGLLQGFPLSVMDFQKALNKLLKEG
jgi:hypothetical protein